ncbi:MAG: hypothetical protein E7020_05395 [Alphaproteobacteria bacterium]|nr:hypothetical protein [Alphaproteobacteria bacterium]
MYVWVVLTTFLAMIAAYILPIREDTNKLVNTPVAQARLMQMVVKQKAGKQYMKENQWPYFSTQAEKKVNYTTGVITADKMANYLPHGFINNDEYTTVIYCLDEDMTTIRTGEDACRKVGSETVVKVLITYGPIPEKWQAIFAEGEGEGVTYDIKPSQDMINAFRSHFGVTEMVGYTIVEDGLIKIVNYEGTKFDVPAIIANDTEYSGYSLSNCIDDYTTCLAYMD